MDVRWDQALDSLEMDRQAIIDCAERLSLLSNQIQEKSKTWPLAKLMQDYSVSCCLLLIELRMSRCQRT